MNITIVGCGNVGAQLAVHSAAKGHNVTIYCSKPEKVSKKMEIIDPEGKVVLSGNICLATADEKVAFCDADLLFVTVPSFCMQEYADRIIPFLKRGTAICIVPGCGGGEFAFKKALENDNVVFGLQRVPSVARLKEYGKTVCASGYRDRLFVASMPHRFAGQLADIISGILDMPCSPMPNYLNLTLTPSNPILHTTRLKTIFHDYYPGKVYKQIPLFYEEWSDESSDLLLACDQELQNICSALNEFDLSFVKSLKEHYESANAHELTNKITSIKSFKGIKTPCVQYENGYIPDFSSRYFKADFPYGLFILIEFAKLLDVSVLNMKSTYDWYKKLVGDNKEFSLSNYGITDVKKLIEFYKK